MIKISKNKLTLWRKEALFLKKDIDTDTYFDLNSYVIKILKEMNDKIMALTQELMDRNLIDKDSQSK